MKKSIDSKKIISQLESSLTAENAFMALLIFLLVFIRFIGFGSIPGGFNQDGAMAAIDGLALATYGTDHLGTFMPAHLESWGYGQMSSLLSYLMVPFIKLWGLNTITARLPILLASIAGALALYSFTKHICDKRASVIVLFLTIFNPWHYMQSRWALDCNLFPHMFIIGLFFLVKGLQKSVYLYLSMVFFALCMYSYGVSFYMVPIFLLAACIMLLATKRVKWKQVLLAALVYFLIAWPIYGTMLINFMKWNTVSLPFVTMQYFPDSVRSADIVFFTEEPLKQIGINFKAVWNVVFAQKPDLIWNAIDEFGTMYRFTMPFVFLGLVLTIIKAVKEKEPVPKTGYRLLLLYWLCSLFTGICINSVNVNRINIIFYSHILFAGIAIYWLTKQVKLLIIAFALLYSIAGCSFLHTYFTEWSDTMESHFYADFMDAMEFAKNYNSNYYYLTPNTQYQGSWHVTRALTLFGMQIDAKYYQGETTSFEGCDVPYTYRYQYRVPEDWEIYTDNDVCYVMEKNQLWRFSSYDFAITEFGDYFVAIPYAFVN